MSNTKCSNCGGSGKHIGMLGINPNNWPVCTSCNGNGTGVIEDTKSILGMSEEKFTALAEQAGNESGEAMNKLVSSRSTYLEAILSPQIMNEDTCPECRVNFTEAIKAIENLILLREQEAYNVGYKQGIHDLLTPKEDNENE